MEVDVSPANAEIMEVLGMKCDSNVPLLECVRLPFPISLHIVRMKFNRQKNRSI